MQNQHWGSQMKRKICLKLENLVHFLICFKIASDNGFHDLKYIFSISTNRKKPQESVFSAAILWGKRNIIENFLLRKVPIVKYFSIVNFLQLINHL